MKTWQFQVALAVILGMGVAALSTYNTRSMLAQGSGATKLNCDNPPCAAVARGRAALNDRNLKQLGGNGRACIPSETIEEIK